MVKSPKLVSSPKKFPFGWMIDVSEVFGKINQYLALDYEQVEIRIGF
jgi:hypothetical protein